MDAATAARVTQSGLSGNARATAPAVLSDVDLGGTVWSGTVQGRPEAAPQRSTNPVCASTAGTWSAFGTSGFSGGRVTGLSGMLATTGYRAVNGSTAGAVAVYGDSVPVTPGESVQGTLQVRPSVALTNLAWHLVYLNSSGAQVGSTAGPANVSVAAGAVAARAITGGVVPAGAVTAKVAIIATSMPASATLIATGHRVATNTDDTAMAYAASVSCSADIVFRDAAGTQLATTTGTTATTSTGVAVRPPTTVATAPAGTRRVELVFLARAVAAQSVLHATAARLAPVNDAALPFADVQSPGWAHEGAAGASASSCRALDHYDDVSGLSDRALAGRVPQTGPTAWAAFAPSNAAGQAPVIRNGAIGPPSGHTPGMGSGGAAAGYAMRDVIRPVEWVGGDLRWDSSASKASSVALGAFTGLDHAAFVASGGSNLHLAVTLESVELAVFQGGTGNYTRLVPVSAPAGAGVTSIPLGVPMVADGATVTPVDVWRDPVDRSVAYIKVGTNPTLTYTHPWIRDVPAGCPFWEYFTVAGGTNIGRFVRTWARAAPSTEIDGENACPNPDARAPFGGWGFTAGGGTTSYVTGVAGLSASTAYRITRGSTANDVWSYGPHHVPGRDMGGETWSVVIEGTPSASASCSAVLLPRDANDAFLTATYGTAVTVAAGGVFRQVVTATLPAGTRRLGVALLARALPAGATLTATAARYRRGSWPSLPYADGSSPGWGWDVREGGTSRRQLPAEWVAATDGTTASSVGTSIGYTGTQYQAGGGSIQNNYTPIPVEAAPYGRPGRAARVTIGENVQRYEHNPDHRSFDVGDDVFFSTAFALGGDFPLDANDFQIIEQIHQAWGSWSPPVAFEVRQGGLYLTGGNGLPNGNSTGNPQEFAHFQRLADLQRERWYSLVYRIGNFSEATGGSELWVWLDGVLILDDWTIPCPTIVQGDASTRLSYRKQGFYHRPSLPGGTVWHAGAAMGNNYAAVDPYRAPLFQTFQGAASAVSGSLAALGAPTVGTAGAATSVSGSRAELAGPRLATTAAATAVSGSRATSSEYVVGAATAAATSGSRAATSSPSATLTPGLLPSISGTRAAVAPSVMGGGAATSGTRAETTPVNVGAATATAMSGTLVLAGASVNPPMGAPAVSGTRAGSAALLEAAAAAQVVSGSRATASGVRETAADTHGVESTTNAAVLADGPTFYTTGEPGPDVAGGRPIWASPAGSEQYQSRPRGGSAFAVRNTRYRGVNGGEWLSTPQMSVEAWLYIPNPASGVFQNLVDTRSNPSGTWAGWQLYLNPTGTLTFSAGVGTGQGGVTAPTPIPAGVWVHVAATCDGPTRRIYINGELVVQGVVAAGYNPVEQSTHLRFGVSVNHDGAALDDIAVYDYPLTAAQVTAHYAWTPSRLPGVISGTVAALGAALLERSAAAEAVSGSRVEVAAAVGALATTRSVSATLAGAVAFGTTITVSGTRAETTARQTVVAVAVAVTATRADLADARSESRPGAAARSGTLGDLAAGVVVATAAPADGLSGTRADLAAPVRSRPGDAAAVSGTLAGSLARIGLPAAAAAVSGVVVIATASEPFRPVFQVPTGRPIPITPIPTQRLLIADTITGKIVAEFPTTALSWNTPLNKIAQCSATLPVEGVLDELASGGGNPRTRIRAFLTGPYRFSLVVAFGGTALMGGPLLPTEDVTDQRIKVDARGLERMWEKRRLVRRDTNLAALPWTDERRDYRFTSTTTAKAVEYLVGSAISDFDPARPRTLPIIIRRPPAAQGDLDFHWPSHERTSVWKAISDLAERDDGPDVRLEPELYEKTDGLYVRWDLQIGAPTFDVGIGTPGPEGPLPWTWDDTTSTITRSVDALGLATAQFSAGGGQDRAKAVGFAQSDTLTRLGFPELEEDDATADNDADASAAQRRARAMLAGHERPTDTWSVATRALGRPQLGTYRRGDVARLDVRNKLLIEPGVYERRITDVASTDGVNVTISCDHEDGLVTA